METKKLYELGSHFSLLMSPLFLFPRWPGPGCHVLTINAGRPPRHQGPAGAPWPGPGARYHSRKLEFSGILDKVHTRAPDLTLDKQCPQ